jgi:hypothetical protein
MVQAKQTKTLEDEERIWRRIEGVLDRMKEEAEAGRGTMKTVVTIAAGVGVVVLGDAVAIATKNPELMKKGIEMVAKETVKSVTKL